MSDEEWWFTRSSLLEQVSPDFAERFPMVTWLQLKAAEDEHAAGDDTVPYLEREARKTFEAGLAVVLDGIEAAVKGAGPRSRRLYFVD